MYQLQTVLVENLARKRLIAQIVSIARISPKENTKLRLEEMLSEFHVLPGFISATWQRTTQGLPTVHLRER